VGQIGDGLAGRAPAPIPNGSDLVDLVVEHYDGVLEEYGLSVGVRAARKHLDWYLEAAGIELAKETRWSLLNSQEPGDVRRMIREFYASPMREAA
jgi:tRNA-dihydrouridine synthase B